MPLSKDKVFKSADGYIRSGKIEKAVAEYEKWVAENPTDWNTIRQIGDLYARIGRNAEAIQNYTKIAEFYRKDGFNVRAIATYKMILRLDPQHEQAMRNLAELQVQQGLFMEAKAQFQALVELYGKAGQKRKALEVFKKLAEIDPTDLKVRYKYAEFLDREGKVAEAVAEYTGIADEFINKGLVSEACQILEKGLRIDATSKILRGKMAQAACLQGEFPKAIKLLEEIRDQHPRDVELLSGLGDAYMGASRLEEAGALFRRLAEIEPDNPQHALKLAELAISQGRFDPALELLAPAVDSFVTRRDGERAAQLLQKILSREPNHTKTLLKLVEVYTVLQHDSGRISAYDQLCEAYVQRGDFDRAADVAQQLIELEPENFQHRDRLRFLRARKGAGKEPSATPLPELVSFEPLDPSAPEVDATPVSEQVRRPLRVGAAVKNEPRTEEEVAVVAQLSPEDEEHVREKFTEAEVFVRYGLVEKAISQLKDLLQSFPFHAGTREKLVEVYTDQGMNDEAGEQMLELSRIYQRMGDSDRAAEFRDQAVELNAALAADARAIEPGRDEDRDEDMELLPPSDESEFGEAIDLLTTTNSGLGFGRSSVPAAPASLGSSAALLEEEEEEIPIAIEEDDLAPSQAIDTEAAEEVSMGALSIDIELPSFEMDPPSLDLGRPSLEMPLPAPASPSSPADVAEDMAEEVFRVEDSGVSAILEPFSVRGPDSEGSIEFEVEGDDSFEQRTVKLPPLDLRRPPPAPPPEPASEEEIEIAIDASSPALEMPADPLRIDAEEMPSEKTDPFGMREPVRLARSAPAPLPSALPRAAPSPRATPPRMPLGEAFREKLREIPGSEPQAPPAPSSRGRHAAIDLPELAEVDEYVALGLFEDARDTLAELLTSRPDDPRIVAKIEELGFSVAQIEAGAGGSTERSDRPLYAREPLRVSASEPVFEEPFAGLGSIPDEPVVSPAAAFERASQAPIFSPTMKEGDVFVDLASEISDEMFGTQNAVEERDDIRPSTGPLSDGNLEEIFREFKKGVEKQLGSEDYDTRYNLGIAYKEMGLLDEAVAEFQLASKDEGRLLECCSMLGLCFMEKGMPEIAIKWFEKGLKAPGRSEEEYHGLRYDLATAYEAAGGLERALELYMEIYRVNNKFRDVRHRVRELQAAKK